MDKQQEPLETLREIRSFMERSSRFMSLSGLSGVVAGTAAICGVAAAYLQLGLSATEPGYYLHAVDEHGKPNNSFHFLIADFVIVLLIALLAGTLLSIRQAAKLGQPVSDNTAKRLLINMIIPLLAGGIYCIILLYHGHIALVAPATLIFYGLTLLNASKYTVNDIRYLGVLEIITGLAASLIVEYGLLFWAFGFGVLHVIYGTLMYFKYEK